jgi:hypothetical protein
LQTDEVSLKSTKPMTTKMDLVKIVPITTWL